MGLITGSVPDVSRTALLAIAVAVMSACHVGMPGRLTVPATPSVRANAEVRLEAQFGAQGQVAAEAAVAVEGSGTVEFFGIPLEGAQDVVFVLDRSGSMLSRAGGFLAPVRSDGRRPRKITVAQEELVEALDRLPDGTRTNVIFFHHALDAFSPDLVSLDQASREHFVGFVKAIVPAGRTALAPAMRIALTMNPRRLVLLSDGLGNVGGGSDAVLRDARAAIAGSGVRIDTVSLGSDADEALMQALASESGGLYQAF